jgi:hypothetical protein
MGSMARAQRSIPRSQRVSVRGVGRRVAAALAIAALGLAASTAGADVRASERAVHELERLEGDAFTLQASLRAARANHDPTRATCLDDALTRVHVATRTARGLSDAIAAEERAGDSLRLEHDLIRLTHLGERTREVVAVARRCGMPEGAVGNERTTVTAYLPLLPPNADAFPRPPFPHAP